MRTVEALEIGLMFWSTGDPEADLCSLRNFGVAAGQLGISGEVDLDAVAPKWCRTLAEQQDIALTTAVCAYSGEDYSDLEAVRQTVGFTPGSTREVRLARTRRVAEMAASLGIGSIGCHIGFVPEDRTDPTYLQLCLAVRDLCDFMAQRELTFALETGQERAEALLHFIGDVARPNLKVNFDPANLILYGMGDPIQSLQTVSRHVVSIHCKDAVPPAEPGALGREVKLGSGQVDFPAFLHMLRDSGYQGILSIEREEPDREVRRTDITHAVSFLRGLLAFNSPAV